MANKPLHEVLLGIIAGEHDDVLTEYDSIFWGTQYVAIHALGLGHIPDEARGEVADKLIEFAEEVIDDEVSTAIAAALKNVDGVDKLKAAHEAADDESENKANLEAVLDIIEPPAEEQKKE